MESNGSVPVVTRVFGSFNSSLNNDFRDRGFFDDTEYFYDGNGNMIKDLNKGDSIVYNHLNQPEKVIIGENKTVYVYTATGGMLKTEIYENNCLKTVTDYSGAFVYENDTLAYINIPGGRIVKNSSFEGGQGDVFEYNLTDHLGNVRVTFAKNETTGNAEIIQEDHYYPFGLRMSGMHYENTTLMNKFLYNGKELQEQTNYIDYGFRQTDPQLGRWHVIDAMAENYFSTSPYAYVRNNPISRFDVMGLWDDDPSDYDNDGGDGNYNGGDSYGDLEFSWNNLFGFGENMSNWFRWTMTGTGVHPLFLEYGGYEGSHDTNNNSARDIDKKNDPWWDEESDTNVRTIPDDVKKVLIEQIRLTFKYEMFSVASNKNSQRNYNNGITELGINTNGRIYKPVNFNTRIHYKEGALESNFYYSLINLEVGDKRIQMKAQIWYTVAGYEEMNWAYYVGWIEGKDQSIKAMNMPEIFEGWRRITIKNKAMNTFINIGVSSSDFELLMNYFNTGKID